VNSDEVKILFCTSKEKGKTTLFFTSPEKYFLYIFMKSLLWTFFMNGLLFTTAVYQLPVAGGVTRPPATVFATKCAEAADA
jgi:hypothetical protein